MSALTSSQLQVLHKVLSVGRKEGASPKELKAAVETGLVESNLSNPQGGDGDSAGWRQERRSLYSNPTNVTASAERFFSEARAVRGKYGSAGQLAAAVQRPAAQYRDRYQQRSGQADQLLSAAGGAPRAAPAASATTTTTSSNAAEVGAANESNRKRAIVLNLLTKHNPNSLLVTSGALDPQSVPALKSVVESRTVKSASQVAAPGTDAGNLAQIVQRAAKLDSRHLPYLWGGGHGGKGNVATTGPVDCSGAVSEVLGINPKVSGDFAKWGKSGAGKSVTIYANAEHVIMEINGHFFGTSASNPGGGAGWIPRSAINASYLSKFTARHPAGM